MLEPGQVMSLYHWEADQEDFLVVSGEALLLVEGDERPLRAWDFVHCPPGTKHTIVGAGDGRCVIVSVGARALSITDDWGAYVPDAAAARHGASVAEESTDPDTAYDELGEREPARYDGFLPG
ncbi:MAG TPA: cupin domain-containing protein [Gaiellaceae bacterium]|nr:cupin domain-containing protein [Gaiellaceae bacterium]